MGLNLVDHAGRPMNYHGSDPGLKGGWVESGLSGMAEAPTQVFQQFTRQSQRRAARVAYLTNPLVYSGIRLILSYVLGGEFSYGQVDDDAAQDTLEEFWLKNDFGKLARRLYLEYLIDGETAPAFQKRKRGRKRNLKILLPDVDKISIEQSNGEVEEVSVNADNRRVTWQEGEFVWQAHDALWNDARGFPFAMQALPPALSYIGLLDDRRQMHKNQARLNMVYHALVDAAQADGGLAEQTKKAAIWGMMPRNQSVVTLAKDKTTGQMEELAFLKTGAGGSDAAIDGRLIKLLFINCLQLPEHFMGDGSNENRSTSQAMADPARRGFLTHQDVAGEMFDKLMRIALIKRHGKSKLYTRRKVRIKMHENGGIDKKVDAVQVPASQFFFPWIFPNVQMHDIEALTKKIETLASHQLASRQTQATILGIDWSEEQERLAIEEASGEGQEPVQKTQPKQEPQDE